MRHDSYLISLFEPSEQRIAAIFLCSSGGLYRKQFLTENKKKGPALYTPRVKHHLPFFDELIVVEGFNDLRAVAETVNATVSVTEAWISSDHFVKCYTTTW